ncbi:14318_t:CDS:1, partial [Racocetra fulgida]
IINNIKVKIFYILYRYSYSQFINNKTFIVQKENQHELSETIETIDLTSKEPLVCSSIMNSLESSDLPEVTSNDNTKLKNIKEPII